MTKMILIITNKDDITVDFVVRLLVKDGVAYYRFNTEDLFSNVNIRFRNDEDQFILFDKAKETVIDLNDVTSVYFRRPGISDFRNVEGISEDERRYMVRETLAILDGIYKRLRYCFWINDVFKIREAENKIFQLELAKTVGFKIPKTILSNDIDFVKDAFKENVGTDIVIKAVKSGNINPKKAEDIIFTSDVCLDEISDSNIKDFPAYIQEKVEKKSDLRSIVVGNKVFTAEIISQDDAAAKTDWRKSPNLLEHRGFTLPEDVKKKCIAITKRLGLVYSAIDFALNKNGECIFLECNPNGQWAWIENRLNFHISNSIEELLVHGNTV